MLLLREVPSLHGQGINMISELPEPSDDLQKSHRFIRYPRSENGRCITPLALLRVIVTNPWFISFVLTISVYAICILSGRMRFLTNDDMSIQEALSGNLTGSPYPFHPFISSLLGHVLSRVYVAFPGHPWWFLYDHLLMVTGVILIGHSLLRVLRAVRLPRLFAIVFVLLFDFTFFFYPIMCVSFTIVPCVLGAGFMMELVINGKRCPYWLLTVICAATALVCTCHRSESGLVICGFICVALFVCSLRELGGVSVPVSSGGENARRRQVSGVARHYLPALVASIVVTLAIPLYNRSIMARIDSQDYVTFNAARSRFNDYPHDTYDNNPALFQEVGWDRDLYKLAVNWFFMDDAINREAFEHITQGSRIQARSTNLVDLSHRAAALMGEKHLIPEFIACSVCLASCAVVLWSRRDRLGMLALAVDIALMVSLICIQLYTGRALYRSVVITVFPTILLALEIAFWTDSAERDSAGFRDSLGVLSSQHSRLFAVMLVALSLTSSVMVLTFPLSRSR